MRNGYFRHLAVFLVLGAGILGCDTTDGPGSDPEDQAVRIISPVGGQAFKVYDTVQIVVESDYAEFGGGVSVAYSPDSARNWYLIQSFSRKAGVPGVARDTARWIAQESGDAADGAVILLRAYDYGKEFVMTLSEGIVFSD